MRAPYLASAIALAALMLDARPAWAVTGPPPPQAPTATDAATGPSGLETGAEIDPGGDLFVDAWGICRYVQAAPTTPANEFIPLMTAAEYQAYRYGINTHGPPPGVTETVCCRPQAVTLCQGAAGGTVTETLPYTVFAGTQTPVATCTDAWGKSYTDSQTWTCGQTGSGVAADGQWNQPGGDSYGCTPNAFTSGCSASCGGGTQTTYDSCGNVQSTSSCNTQSCCTPNWQASYGSCDQTSGQRTVTETDVNGCESPNSYTSQQACTWTEIGGGSCSLYPCYIPAIPPPQGPRMGWTCGQNDIVYGSCPECGTCPSDWSTWGSQAGNCTYYQNPPGYVTSYSCYQYE